MKTSNFFKPVYNFEQFLPPDISDYTFPPYCNPGEFLGENPIENPGLYDFSVNFIVANLYRNQPVIISGQENILDPKEPAIIVPSHGGFGDIPAVAKTFSDRRLNFMSTPTFMSNPVVGPWFRRCGTICLTKGALDAKTFTETSKRLWYETDNSVVIFPEGHLRRGYDIKKTQRGAAVLAGTNGVKVSPVGIVGPEYLRYLPFGTPLITHVGEAFETPFVDAQELSDSMRGYRFSAENHKILKETNVQILDAIQSALYVAKTVESEFKNRVSLAFDNRDYKKAPKAIKLAVAEIYQGVLSGNTTKESEELYTQIGKRLGRIERLFAD